jgi:hypothetical protein
MAYGTSLASFNVEGFGTERVAETGAESVARRVEDLVQFAHFEHVGVQLIAG